MSSTLRRASTCCIKGWASLEDALAFFFFFTFMAAGYALGCSWSLA